MCLGDVETYNEILKKERDHDLNNTTHNCGLFYCLPRKQVLLAGYFFQLLNISIF